LSIDHYERPDRRHPWTLLLAITLGVALFIGLFGLWQPVRIDVWDKFGRQITCGHGYASDLGQLKYAQPGADLASQCSSALLNRRLWAIPVTLIAGIGLMTVAILSVRGKRDESDDVGT
jgi:hypothetical protein